MNDEAPGSLDKILIIENRYDAHFFMCKSWFTKVSIKNEMCKRTVFKLKKNLRKIINQKQSKHAHTSTESRDRIRCLEGVSVKVK